MSERIRPEDLNLVQQARLRAEVASQALEILQLRAFVRYGLREADSFDIQTGVITRAPETPQADG